MRTRLNLIAGIFTAAALATGAGTVFASSQEDDGNFCMDVEIEPFHLMPDGSCTVRDYFDGELQEMFYPFTEKDHLFNCEVFGPAIPMPFGDVPASVATPSEAPIVGTIGGYPFEADLMCASLTNWYQEWCPDPSVPEKCFQMMQPFMGFDQPYPRVTEVSLFDGAVTVQKGKNKTIPLVMATRASGITHVEDLSAPLVGASFTHDLLGMVTYDADDEDELELKTLDGSVDLLLQGHIFFPGPVSDDDKAARVKGTICSKDLYKMLNGKGKKKGRDDD